MYWLLCILCKKSRLKVFLIHQPILNFWICWLHKALLHDFHALSMQNRYFEYSSFLFRNRVFCFFVLNQNAIMLYTMLTIRIQQDVNYEPYLWLTNMWHHTIPRINGVTITWSYSGHVIVIHFICADKHFFKILK